MLKGYGLDRAFIHSTGHGLGLEIHEPPRLGKRDKGRLKAGMAITIEPGAYIEGFGGIRIEDTVVVTWHILQATSVRYPKLEVASVAAVLGLAYSHAGRPAEAESCARQAVSMAEEVYGSGNPRLGFFLATSAATLRQIDRKSEAQEMQKRADAILERRPRATSGGDTVSVNAMR